MRQLTINLDFSTLNKSYEKWAENLCNCRNRLNGFGIIWMLKKQFEIRTKLQIQPSTSLTYD